jgi:hypothetical protein
MLSFVEHNFALDPLTVAVTHSYDYANSFDFGQEPLPGPDMVTTSISAREQAILAKERPALEDDPT